MDVRRPPVLDISVASARWNQGSDGEQADYQDQLEAFFEAAGTWLEFYGEARALASRKQSVLRLELTLSERRARGRMGRLGLCCCVSPQQSAVSPPPTPPPYQPPHLNGLRE